MEVPAKHLFACCRRPAHRRPFQPQFLSGIWPLIVALLVAWPFSLRAVPPANDQCAGAQEVPSNGPFPYATITVDISDATITGDPPRPSCPTFPSTASRSVWYTFTPAVGELYKISTCGDAGAATTVPDTILAIYGSTNGCLGPFTEIQDGCDDDTCTYQAQIIARLNAGQTYYIVAWQFDSSIPLSGQGFLQIIVDHGAPVNDTCATAKTVLLNTPVFGTTMFASDDYRLNSSDCFTGIGQTPSGQTPGRDVVYTFTAPGSDNYSIKVRNYNYDPSGSPPGFDLVLYVTDQCPGGAGPILVTNCLAAANRNSAGISEEIPCLHLDPFQKIYIFVDDRFATNNGSTFLLEVTRCFQEQEPNTRTNANVFVCEITGNINPPGESDFFALGDYPAGWRAFALLDAVAANQSAFELRVVTSTDTIQFDDNDNDIPFGSLAPNIAGAPLPGGLAFLRVNSDSLSSLSPYKLYAVVQPPIANATVEVEPNTSPALANSAPNNYFYGSLPAIPPAPSTDVDVYRFTAEAGDLIFVSLDADPMRNNTPIDAALDLLNSSGSVLLSVDDGNALSNTNRLAGVNSNYPTSPGESLAYRAPYSGNYYARVYISPYRTSPASVRSGDYLLSISKNCFAGAGTNTAPRVTALAMNAPIGENDTLTLSGTVVDPDAGPKYKVVIDWADGSPFTTNDLEVAEYNFSASHKYLDDNAADRYPINIIVFDNYGLAGVTTTNATVTNYDPASLIATLSATNILEGGSVTLSGSFTDRGTLDTHTVTINWGDGSANSVLNLGVGTLTFSTPHTYLNNPASGTDFTITITAADDDSGSTSITKTVLVQNVGPQNVVVSASPTNINENSSITLNVSFADPGADTHSIMVNWGDGSTSSNFLASGLSNLSLNHTYRDDPPTGTPVDTVLIGVLVVDDRSSASSGTSVRVTNLPPVLSNLAITTPINSTSNATLSGNISDASPLDILTARVNWGDGSALQSTQFPLGTPSFSLNHAYTATQTTTFTVNVTLSDDDTGSVSSNVTVRVQAQASSATFKSIKYQTNSVVLQLQGTPNATYRIFGANDRFQWILLGSQTANAQGAFQFQDNSPPPGGRFYRAIWP